MEGGAVLKILKISLWRRGEGRGLSRGGRPRIGRLGKQGRNTKLCRNYEKLNSELRTMNHDGQKSTKWAVAVQSKDYEFM